MKRFIYMVIVFALASSAAIFIIIKLGQQPEKQPLAGVGAEAQTVSSKIPDVYMQPLMVSQGEKSLIVTPLAGNAVKVEHTDNQYIYRLAYPQTDVVQTDYKYKIKEELVFHAPGHPLEFRYQLGNVDKYKVEKDKNGNIIFYDKVLYQQYGGASTLSRVFTIPTPFIEDSQRYRSFNDVEAVISGNLLVVTINQSFFNNASYPVTVDPTIEINVLNVYSHPSEGSNWTVDFVTKGQADLKIIPNDQATIDDDEFVSLSCLPAEASAKEGDGQNLQPQILAGDVIYYPNWSCSGTGQVVHYTKKAGKHTLRFEFGGEIAYAHNLSTGDGADGWVIISSSKNINTDVLGNSRSTYADGTSTAVTANPTGSAISVVNTTGFAANDEILLINLRGASGDTADVGNYEFLTVSTVPNGTTLNLSSSIQKSYDGITFSNQKVVVQRVPHWTTVTIQNGGTLTSNDWSGTSGGVVVFRATGAVTVDSGGNLNVNGKGYVLGTGGSGAGVNATGTQAESYSGVGSQSGNNNNGGGGGGSISIPSPSVDFCGEGGGGGGYGAVGTVGGYGSSCVGTKWQTNAGATYGVADLSQIFLGSGGGGGGKDNDSGSTNGGNGGDSGGIIMIISDSISVSGALESNGVAGADMATGDNGAGGGGSGGSIYMAANSVTLAANTTKAVAGAGGSNSGNPTWSGLGGTGGSGRIRIEADSISGTTDPVASTAGTPSGGGCATASTSPGTMSTAYYGAYDWTNPDYAKSSNNSYAESYIDAYEISYYLEATNFNFSIPPTATINGVIVEVERYTGIDEFSDEVARLIVGGIIQGDNKAKTLASWPLTDPNTYENYGGVSDKWGLSLTAAQVNYSDFGFALAVYNHNGSAIPEYAYIDHIRIKVFYTPSGGSCGGTASTTTVILKPGVIFKRGVILK